MVISVSKENYSKLVKYGIKNNVNSVDEVLQELLKGDN